MRLLLHTCCAPCLIYPLQSLREKNFEVEGFFYNPNIHGISEYKYRKKAVEEISGIKKVKINFGDYDLENFFKAVVGNEEKLKRCPICWQMRLEKSAQFAKENNFEYFTTTLLVSPYQDIEIIRKIGEDVAQKTKVKFYFEDFRSGFRTAHEEAKQRNIYCQRYCGCVYSERERYTKRRL
jgi:predicted adenine nucleotide alpha hydrolase (AANH) superfamily ATPase